MAGFSTAVRHLAMAAWLGAVTVLSSSGAAAHHAPALQQPPGRIEGRVLDIVTESGRPLHGVTLRARQLHGATVNDRVFATSDADGRMRVPPWVRSEGAYLSLEKRGRASSVLDLSRSGPGLVTLHRGVTWSGTVVDESGQPLEGAKVAVVPSAYLTGALPLPAWLQFGLEPTIERSRPAAQRDAVPLAIGSTGADGSFAVPGGLPSGVQLVAYAAGRAPIRTEFLAARGAVRLVLPKTGSLRGQVVGDDGEPRLADVRVTDEHGVQQHARTDERGRFVVTRPSRTRCFVAVRTSEQERAGLVVDAGTDADLSVLTCVAPTTGQSGTVFMRDHGVGAVYRTPTIAAEPVETRLGFGTHLVGQLDSAVPSFGYLLDLESPHGSSLRFVPGGSEAVQIGRRRLGPRFGFEFEGMPWGRWDLWLTGPTRTFRRHPARTRIGSVELQSGAARVEFTGDAAPGVTVPVSGRIELEGVSLDASQLVVEVRRVVPEGERTSGVMVGRLGYQHAASTAALRPDGAFQLELVPGIWRLSSVDMRTGLTLAVGDAVVVEPRAPVPDITLRGAVGSLRVETVPSASGFAGRVLSLETASAVDPVERYVIEDAPEGPHVADWRTHAPRGRQIGFVELPWAPRRFEILVPVGMVKPVVDGEPFEDWPTAAAPGVEWRPISIAMPDELPPVSIEPGMVHDIGLRFE